MEEKKEVKSSKKIKVIKTDNLIPGVCSSAKFIGKELQGKLNAGEVVELDLKQVNQLKKYGWVKIYKEK